MMMTTTTANDTPARFDTEVAQRLARAARAAWTSGTNRRAEALEQLATAIACGDLSAADLAPVLLEPAAPAARLTNQPVRLTVEIDSKLGRALLARRVHLQDLRHDWEPEEIAAILLARAFADRNDPPHTA